MRSVVRTPSVFFADPLPMIALHRLTLDAASAEHVVRCAQGGTGTLFCEDAQGQTFSLSLRTSIKPSSLCPLLQEFLRRQGVDLYKQGSVIFISFAHYSDGRPTDSPFYLVFFGQDESRVIQFVEISREEVSLAAHIEKGQAFAA